MKAKPTAKKLTRLNSYIPSFEAFQLKYMAVQAAKKFTQTRRFPKKESSSLDNILIICSNDIKTRFLRP